MGKVDRRERAELLSKELADMLDPAALENIRSDLAPFTATLRSRINKEDPAASSESAEAALALQFVYRELLGHRNKDQVTPESQAFACFLGRYLTKLAGGVESERDYAIEDAAALNQLTLEQIDQLRQSGLSEPHVLLTTQSAHPALAVTRRQTIENVMERFASQNYDIIKEIDEPEPGLTVYSTIVPLPESKFQLMCRSYCWQGTSFPADTELLLMPPEAKV